jgi:predicted phosphodiesterase
MTKNPRVLSRRSLVQGVAAGAAALVCPLKFRVAAAEDSPVRFLVVSDTHLGYKDQESAAQQWQRTAAELARAEGQFVLHLGDVVDGGREAQYPKYVEIRQAIGKTVHEIPGNHDPAELFERHVRKPIDTVVKHEWLRVLLLNNSRPESHDGFLSPAQLAWMDAQCADAAKADQFVIIGMHVPVHENRHPDRGWYVKKEHGQAEFYALAQRHARRLLAVFHGHFHNGLRGWTDHAPVHEISFPSALYNQDRKLEEQHAPGYNPTEFRPGFTSVEITATAIRLEFKPVGHDVAVKKELPRD